MKAYRSAIKTVLHKIGKPNWLSRMAVSENFRVTSTGGLAGSDFARPNKLSHPVAAAQWYLQSQRGPPVLRPEYKR